MECRVPYRSGSLQLQGKKGLDHSTGNTCISFYLIPKAASSVTNVGLALADTSRQRVVLLSSEEANCDMCKVFYDFSNSDSWASGGLSEI